MNKVEQQHFDACASVYETEIGEEYIGEVDQITAVAGVRGKESEDEILNYLYQTIGV